MTFRHGDVIFGKLEYVEIKRFLQFFLKRQNGSASIFLGLERKHFVTTCIEKHCTLSLALASLIIYRLNFSAIFITVRKIVGRASCLTYDFVTCTDFFRAKH